MYRTTDPRFRRRLNELGQTIEHANESAQSSIYIFGQNYVAPCFNSITGCLTSCVDASCPSLNLSQRDRLRRQRGRAQIRGRAELNFDFYDDWDEEENDPGGGEWGGGWGGSDEFDRLLAGGGTGGGYGATAGHGQPARQRGMSYPKTRRRSAGAPLDAALDPTVIPGSTSWFGRLFGGARSNNLRYKPSAADLQEHPGTLRLGRDLEAEALLEESSDASGHRSGGRRKQRQHTRARSGTAGSGETTDSFSSRGDIFPSDDEDDAIPLDDEFAMVLERRTTGGGGGGETESSSGKTGSHRRRGKRPSAGSRTSTRRTVSSRSTRSSTMGSSAGRQSRSRRASSAAVLPQSPVEDVETSLVLDDDEDEGEDAEVDPPSITELKLEERRVEMEEEAEVERRRKEAQKLAEERGLVESEELREDAHGKDSETKEGKPLEAEPSPTSAPSQPSEEPSQLPTPLATDDEDDQPELTATTASGTSETSTVKS